MGAVIPAEAFPVPIGLGTVALSARFIYHVPGCCIRRLHRVPC